MDPADLFFDHPLGMEVLAAVRAAIKGFGDVEERTTKSQVAFRRKRGFAYIWLPGMYLANPAAEVVLSIALGRRDDSARFKEVVHPTAAHWMHHLEVSDVEEIDAEVVGWLHEAAESAE